MEKTETKLHPFEASGLGLAPFRLVGVASFPSPSLAEANPTAYQNALRMLPRDPPLGTCNHCGMSLMHNFIVKDRTGKRFVVGSDCVMKCSAESGKRDRLAVEIEIAARKVAAKARKLRAEAKDAAVKAEWEALMSKPEVREALSKLTVPGRPWVPGETVPFLEHVEGVWKMCGASGRAKKLKWVKATLETLKKGES